MSRESPRPAWAGACSTGRRPCCLPAAAACFVPASRLATCLARCYGRAAAAKTKHGGTDLTTGEKSAVTRAVKEGRDIK